MMGKINFEVHEEFPNRINVTIWADDDNIDIRNVISSKQMHDTLDEIVCNFYKKEK